MVVAIPTTPDANTAKVEVVPHWHVTESDAGYLPESEPYTTDNGEMALDYLAHLLDEWADTYDDPEDPDATYAAGIAEIYCTCRDGARCAEHHDAVNAGENGRGICEQIENRVFEMTPCSEKDCLKYCPDPDCGTTVPITDLDERCWCCGATYVSWEDCDWLA